MSDNDWKKRLGVVFSTNPDFAYEDQDAEQERVTIEPSKQRLYVGIEKKNRGGKQVTVVKGFKGESDSLNELGRTLKTKCGTGGNVKDGEILIQGDFREKVLSLLQTMGYNAKRAN